MKYFQNFFLTKIEKIKIGYVIFKKHKINDKSHRFRCLKWQTSVVKMYNKIYASQLGSIKWIADHNLRKQIKQTK